MWLWYNTQLITDKKLILNTNNRAFQYGDGIFETMIVQDGKIQHSAYHTARINYSIGVLKLNFILSMDEISQRISFLLTKNNLKDARVKLMIWRQPGGFYVPEQNNTEYLIMANPRTAVDLSPQHLETSKEIRIPKGITKNCKTLNSLPYILAGLELNERKDADDLLLLDFDGFICECISSNIFWIKDGAFYTPSLETNCVAGIKRKFVLDQLQKQKIDFFEVKATPDVLHHADHMFKTNVTGIYPVKSFEGRSYEIPEKFPFPQTSV